MKVEMNRSGAAEKLAMYRYEAAKREIAIKRKIADKALQDSIYHWEMILLGREVSNGRENCPLCKVFYGNAECRECPIAIHTGKPYCRNTPYTDFSSGKVNKNNIVYVYQELEFLRIVKNARACANQM